MLAIAFKGHVDQPGEDREVCVTFYECFTVLNFDECHQSVLRGTFRQYCSILTAHQTGLRYVTATDFLGVLLSANYSKQKKLYGLQNMIAITNAIVVCPVNLEERA